MAKQVEKFTIKLDVEGLKDLTGLERTLKNFEKSVAPKTTRQVQALGRSIQFVKKSSTQTIASLRQKERALTAIRNITNVNSRSFRSLGNEINRTREQINKFNLTSKKSGGIGGKIGSGFGSLIASQVLPGRTSQLALAGGQFGGAKGAAIGAVLGAGMDFSGLAKDAAVFAGNIKRLEVALKGVTKTQEEFAKAQRVIASVSDGLNVPIANATKQFTTLSASVIGAGGSVSDAELVFRGVSEAIKATGGDAEDVKSAIRAMSQIFGKGKVSAEELQGQLGERLPGAVVKFAQATGRTLPQLQKDLRDGTVGLNDVMKFVVKLSTDHASAAREMANSTADAGQRMRVALDKLKLSFGEFFQPIGAGFQDIITGMVNMLNAALETRNILKMIQLEEGKNVAGSVANKALRDAEKQAFKIAQLRAGVFTEEDYKQGNVHSLSIGKQKPIDMDLYRKLVSEMFRNNLKGYAFEEGIMKAPVTASDLTNFMSPTGDDDKFIKDLQKRLDFTQKLRDEEEKAENEKYNAFLDFQLLSGQITQEKFDQIKLDQEALRISEQLGINIDYVKEALKNAKDATFDFKASFKELYDSVTDLGTNLSTYAIGAVDRLADSFVDLMVTGKASFADLARSILMDLQKMILKALLFQTIFSPFKKAFGLSEGGVVDGGEVKESAKGNVFAKNKIVPYAKGGVISQYANNDGIVTRPTTFPMKEGIGLMGEAGPEAIMPLKRGKDGKLGVTVSRQNQNISNLVSQMIEGVLNGITKNQNTINKYAYGGIVNRPTMGLMGEAGPEAVLPLKRGKGGRLGVEASGGSTNIVVNVDATGSSVAGDEEQGRQLGAVISAAIQSELINQKRPGGLLA